jgi:hypothetical protein
MRRDPVALHNRVRETSLVMRRKAQIRLLPVLLVAALVLAAGACQRKKTPAKEEENMLAMDRVARSPVDTSQQILHKTFAVSSTAKFPFEIPAHAALPHLRGNYRSFVKDLGAQSNGDIANVDFLVLNEDQYADFVGGRAGEALFSAEASHDQDVNIRLPPSQDQPRKYYLIFRNSPGGAAKKFVQADFTVNF